MSLSSLSRYFSSLERTLCVGVSKDLDVTRKCLWLPQFIRTDFVRINLGFTCHNQVALAAAVNTDKWVFPKI